MNSRAALILFISLVLLQGCAGQYYAKVGVGWNGRFDSDQRDQWAGSDSLGGRVAVGNRHRLGGPWWGDLNIYHHSQPFLGKPFNDDPETASEHVYYDVEYWFH